jgi:hypothetical protein
MLDSERKKRNCLKKDWKKNVKSNYKSSWQLMRKIRIYREERKLSRTVGY